MGDKYIEVRDEHGNVVRVGLYATLRAFALHQQADGETACVPFSIEGDARTFWATLEVSEGRDG